MKLNEMINELEVELKTILRDIGVKDINMGDIYKSVPQLPAVNLLLTSADRNELQVFQRGKIGWDLLYDVSCMFAGTERAQTFKNSRTFVNKIYDTIQLQQDNKLNNTVFNIDCIKIEYGKTAVGNEFIDGGLIKVLIQIHEVR